MTTRVRRLRVEACSACQLRCVRCPVHGDVERPAIGNGFLRLSNFQDLVRENPRVREIELANYGEVLLNPDLVRILEYAHDRGVLLTADDGVNLNTAPDDVLEALVKYQLRSMTCSIDGASDGTYRQYRVNGNFSTVMENIRKLNAFKSKYRSELPRLTWQFIVFGHNEHEVLEARRLAGSLGMSFSLKLPWDSEFSPVVNGGLLREHLGAATREEYKRRFGIAYLAEICHDLWTCPQINWDGKVLGCCRNFWGEFGGNAFSDGLGVSVNGAGIRYARQMLLGRKPAKDGVPCATCSVYLDMRAEGKWLKAGEIRAERRRLTWRQQRAKVRKTLPYRGARSIYRSIRPLRSAPRLASRVHPLRVPLPPDEAADWKIYDLFSGSTGGLRTLACHASVLKEGSRPHPPHAHAEEEILLLLSGEVDVVLTDVHAARQEQLIRLEPGQFAYYPRYFAHTLQTAGEGPANYVMFKWSANANTGRTTTPVLPHGLFGTCSHDADGRSAGGLSSRMIFDGPTDYLRKLSCHTSTLAAGRGYPAHADPYDVAIVVLEGEVESLGERVEPNGVIFCAAGAPHGMRNPGLAAARYVVFEFHSHRRGPPRPLVRRGDRLSGSDSK